MELPRSLREVRQLIFKDVFLQKLKGILDMSKFPLSDRNICSGLLRKENILCLENVSLDSLHPY